MLVVLWKDRRARDVLLYEMNNGFVDVFDTYMRIVVELTVDTAKTTKEI